MKGIGCMGLSLVLGFVLAVPALSQQARSAEEYEAYTALYQEQDAQRKAELAEQFLTDFEVSDFRLDSYRILAQSYLNSGNWAGVVDVAARFDQEMPQSEVEVKTFMYERAMQAAQNANDFENTVEYGDKLLEFDPEHLGAQLSLSALIPENLPQDQAAQTAALEKATDLGQKAYDQVEAMFKAPKPADVTEEQWEQQRNLLEGQVHATLGLIHLIKNEFDDAVSVYEHVVELNPRNALGQFRLGMSYNGQFSEASQNLLNYIDLENEAKRTRAGQARIDELVAVRTAIQEDTFQKRDSAIDALAKSVALGGPIGSAARQQLERLYRARNNDSLNGLDALIEQKKSELGV